MKYIHLIVMMELSEPIPDTRTHKLDILQRIRDALDQQIQGAGLLPEGQTARVTRITLTAAGPASPGDQRPICVKIIYPVRPT